MTQLIYWETKVFMTNDAKHEKPLTSSFSFGTSVFTGTGTSDMGPGAADLFVVSIRSDIILIEIYLSEM